MQINYIFMMKSIKPSQLLMLLVYHTIIILNLVISSSARQSFLPGHDLSNFHLPESTPVGSIIYQIKAANQSNQEQEITYSIAGTSLFSVDERTGELTLIKPLDRETNPIERLHIFAFSGENASDGLKRDIKIDDVDDSVPIFHQHKYSILDNNVPTYRAEISELSPIGSQVISEIIITDADEGINADMSIECRPNHSLNYACDIFSIEARRLSSKSGGKISITIRTKSQLDYEKIQSYRLAIVARGKVISPLTGLPLESEAHIDILVMNIQDEGPIFINAPYTLTMKEGLPNGSRILDIIVQDGDAAPQRSIDIGIIPSPFKEYFNLVKDKDDEYRWYLETSATIDRESALVKQANNVLILSLLAAEIGENGLPVASQAEIDRASSNPLSYNQDKLKRENITIVILDEPDSKPIFTRISTGEPIKSGLLVHNISESIETGSTIPNLDLAVYDLDQGINSRFNLSLIDIDIDIDIDHNRETLASNVFALESELIYGKSEVILSVLNSSLLDYENPNFRSYRFNLVASKNLNSQLQQYLEVQINILDSNDNSPEFDKEQYIIEVNEDAKPGTLVATIRAHDIDSGIYGRVEHRLAGLGASKFKLHPIEGKIFLDDCAVTQCLDYETQSSYSLTYEARDGGARTKNVSIIINIIDINDHSPKFSESIYKRELISDNLSSKHNYITPQLIVKAKDADGPTQGRNNITYRMRNSNLTSLDVDPISGLVYLAQPVDLHSIGVSDRPDKRILFEAEVVAEDNGSPMLESSAKIQLVLRSNRDGAPVFRQDLYLAVVKENHPIRKTFYRVQAIDPDDKDSQLRYSLGHDLNDIIAINTTTGELSFKTKVDYDDFKSSKEYNVTVYATDNSRPYPLQASALVSITIQDVNNKSPKFVESEYKIILIQSKTKPDDILIKIQAHDLDINSNLNYSLVMDELLFNDRLGQQFSLNDIINTSNIISNGYLAQMNKENRLRFGNYLKNLFKINKNNGDIRLNIEPDYTLISSITILARVVDLNQEPTQIGATQLQEDLVPCTFLLQTYADRNPIFAPPWTLEKKEYRLSIMEELSIGSVIFSLLAKDPITNKRIENFEKVYESDPKDYFKVDKSGIVYVNRRIDFEELPIPKRLNLTVRAINVIYEGSSTSDDISSSLATLSVLIIDLNDNAPQFNNQTYTASISEATLYPTEIITIRAEDKDSGDNSRIYYSLTGGQSLFSIESRKGSISVRKGLNLDRETESHHILHVVASDCPPYDQASPSESTTLAVLDRKDKQDSYSNCKRSSATVNITLLDENDNDPKFVDVDEQGDLRAVTSEFVSIGSTITRISATDADLGSNSLINYELISSGSDQLSNLLEIDSNGFVRNKEPLSGLGRDSPYSIKIRAYDQGVPSRQTHATLWLKIIDAMLNDGVPRFVKPKKGEIVFMSEIVGPDEFVYQVKALDNDQDANGKLMYRFAEPSDVFEINPFDGTITTQSRYKLHLDREIVSNYTLIIIAQDLGNPPKQDYCVLTIKLTDVNDNEPFFDRAINDPPLEFVIEEETDISKPLGELSAIDNDEGINSLIGYEIIEGNQNNIFRLEYNTTSDEDGSQPAPNKCKIYATMKLDREIKDSYTLTIKAISITKFRHAFLSQFKDPLGFRNNPFYSYNSSDLSKIRVVIRLLDIDDNRPSFNQSTMKGVVDSDTEIYTPIMLIQAHDIDSSSSPIRYTILDSIFYGNGADSLIESSSIDSDTDTDQIKFGNKMFSERSGEVLNMPQVFEVDNKLGVLRNLVSLRPFIDGHFELFIKADSGSSGLQSNTSMKNTTCSNDESRATGSTRSASTHKYSSIESCSVAVLKVTLVVAHQRDTFRFVFNKTMLGDRLNEFKLKFQESLSEIISPEMPLPVASVSQQTESPLRFLLNTMNIDFIEREDGSLDFSTIAACSQLVKFDQNSKEFDGLKANYHGGNQLVSYEEILRIVNKLNSTQNRSKKGSILDSYGVLEVSKCNLDKKFHKIPQAERISIYLAISIAVICSILVIVVHKMRKSYEKNLTLLQRSKYHYMDPMLR